MDKQLNNQMELKRPKLAKPQFYQTNFLWVYLINIRCTLVQIQIYKIRIVSDGKISKMNKCITISAVVIPSLLLE